MFLLLVALVVWATWPTARFAGTRVAGLGDSLEAVWIFGWGAHALTHQPLHLFDSNMFFPEPLTLAYSENLLGISLPAAPRFWVTGNAILTYSVSMIIVLAAGGFGIYRLVVRLGGKPWPAVVSAAAFAVAPYRLVAAQDHPHVVAVYLLPVVLILLLHLRERPSGRTALALGLVLAVQWWSSLTGGVFALVTVGVWGTWELARRRRRAGSALGWAATGVALGLVLSLPVLAPLRPGPPEPSRLRPRHRCGPVLLGAARVVPLARSSLRSWSPFGHRHADQKIPRSRH